MKLVILDRDGVINVESNHYIKSPDEWRPIPGSLEAISLLNQAGYRVAVATNQSGIGRGLYDIAMLDKIHQKLHNELAALNAHIDAIFCCPHHPDAGCLCRKPKPGLLHQISEHFQQSLSGVPFVGDSYCDVVAALAVSCQPSLVKTGNGHKTLNDYPNLENSIAVYDNLSAAVVDLLKMD